MPQYGEPEKQRDPIYWVGPLLGSGILYLAGSTKKVIAVDSSNGNVLGDHDLPDKATVSPVAAMGKLFIVTNDATLSVLG